MSNIPPTPKQVRPNRQRLLDRIITRPVQRTNPATLPESQDDTRRPRNPDARVPSTQSSLQVNYTRSANNNQDCANNGTERQHGWPQQAYSVSKACINALTAVLARENPGLVINACCPGWVSTDMGKMVGSQPLKPPGEFIV